MIARGSVAILLCTYNGAAFLRQQLDSLIYQTYQNVIICASDDGSNDDTLNILNEYRNRIGKDKFLIISGPRKGYANNFIHNLRCHINQAEFFCFCDQDDIWYPTKIQVGIDFISIKKDEPSLYCSRTEIIKANGSSVGFSEYKEIVPCFENALCQSIAGGNTMIFNRNLAMLFQDIESQLQIPSHDWLTYLLVTAAGGYIVYDRNAYIGYRQHDMNEVGDNKGVISKVRRVLAFLNGSYRIWNGCNIRLLETFHRITPPNKLELHFYALIHSGNIFQRIYALTKSKFYRHRRIQTYVFLVGALFKLI